MKKTVFVSTTAFRDNQARYLKAVQEGANVYITQRGKEVPIAKLVPVDVRSMVSEIQATYNANREDLH